MPSRSALTPGAWPKRLTRLGCLPQSEVQRKFLFTFFGRATRYHVIQSLVRQLAIAGKVFHTEIYAAIGLIGISLVYQTLYYFNYLGYFLSRLRIDMRSLDIQSIHVPEIFVNIFFSQLR